MGLLTDNRVWIRSRMANAQLSDMLFLDYQLLVTHLASTQWCVVKTKFSPNQYFRSTSLTRKNILGCGCGNDC